MPERQTPGQFFDILNKRSRNYAGSSSLSPRRQPWRGADAEGRTIVDSTLVAGPKKIVNGFDPV
jgi:hypothetical protein